LFILNIEVIISFIFYRIFKVIIWEKHAYFNGDNLYLSGKTSNQTRNLMEKSAELIYFSCIFSAEIQTTAAASCIYTTARYSA